MSPLVEPHISRYHITEWEREHVVCNSDIRDFCIQEVSFLNVSGAPTGIKLGQDPLPFQCINHCHPIIRRCLDRVTKSVVR
jgi:hypothetical protein